MKKWQVNGRQIYEVGPLEEYLTALDFASTCEGDEHRLVLAVGDSGTGKTVGARIFCRDCDQHPVYIRTPSRQLLTPRGLLELIAEPLGMTIDLRSRYDIAAQIAEESLRRPRILVFDEAQGLAKYDMIDMVRWLHDEGGHTFVMIGMPALEQVFLDHRSFAGRVALRHQLRLPTVTEIAPLFDGFPPDAIEAIHEQARGRMREIVALKERLTDLMEQRKLEASELTPRQVKTVGRHFLLRVA